jgi:predicted N-acyltransferase
MAADYGLRTLAAIGDIAAADWDSLANPGWRLGPHGHIEPTEPDPAAFNPFLSHAFLSALEQSGTTGAEAGWLPHHLLLEQDGRPVAAAPTYVKGHSFGEYVFDQGWADALERSGGHYYPKLQTAVPFTPVTGPRLLARDGNARLALAEGLVLLTRHHRLSSAHVTFADHRDMAALTAKGFLVRHDRQYHFRSDGYRDYADFLDALSSRKRKALKRERREALAGGIAIDWLTGSDLREAHWDAFFDFYMDTGDRKWGTPYLNRAFFSLVSERLADRILLVMARRGDRYIAGALNFIGSDRLYGRYWGAIEPQPFLHFEACYHQAIDFALAHGLQVVEAGAQGEHKIARGYMPVETSSAHFIADPGFRRAVAAFLEEERAMVDAETAALAAEGPFRRGGDNGDQAD